MAGAAWWSSAAQPRRESMAARLAVPLEQIFPTRIGDWRLDAAGPGVTITAREVGQRYQMYNQVLERSYVNAQGDRIMLSVAYGGDQSGSVQMHRPEVCYRSSGFKVSGQHAAVLQLGDRALSVTRLFAQTDTRAEPITYWALLGDELIGSGRSYQWAQLLSGLRGQVRDGMLVRVSSIDTQPERAYALQAGFVVALRQAIAPEQVARVFGAVR